MTPNTPQAGSGVTDDERGELDPRVAEASARQFLSYVESFNGQTFSPTFDSVDRQNLAMALDHLQEAGAMILNLAERVAQSRPPIAKDAAPNQATVLKAMLAEGLPVESLASHIDAAENQINRLMSATPAAGAGGEVGAVDEIVWCGCGDGYPLGSFDGGFIMGRGRCHNCDAFATLATEPADSERLRDLSDSNKYEPGRVVNPAGEDMRRAMEAQATASPAGEGEGKS